MFRTTSRVITLALTAAFVLALCCGAFAAASSVSFNLYSENGYGSAIGGASFRLNNSSGTAVATATTGANGYVVMTIPASALADEGTTKFTLVQTKAPSGYDTTDNNWAVTVTDGNVSIATDGIWDTMFDWLPSTVLTGADYSNGTMTVANIASYYDIPTSYKTVKGLTADQIKGFTSDYQLKSSAGTVVATGHAVGFELQSDGSYRAPIVFDTKKLPADSYTLVETGVSSVSGMDLKSTSAARSYTVTIGANSVGEVVTASYEAPAPANNNGTTTNGGSHHASNSNNSNGSTANGGTTANGNNDNTDNNGASATDNAGTTDNAEVTASPNAGATASPETTINDSETPTSANPGSHSYVWYIVAAVIVIACAVYFILRKKTAAAK